MKNILLIIVLISFCIVTNAQTPYTYTKENNSVILNGIITKYILQNDPAFSWYAANQSGYTDTVLGSAMNSAKGNVRYIVFGGTWCGDTQNIIPKFFKQQEKAGVPDSDISFFAMDRSKKTIGNVGDAFGITNVPTIIIMKGGKEIGRVVEYGTTGKWDHELAALLK